MSFREQYLQKYMTAKYRRDMHGDSVGSVSRSGSNFNSTNGVSLIQNWLRSQTGSGLTDAQIEQNRINAYEADLAFQRQLAMDNTKMLRAAADYAAAGFNPYLAAGSGVSTPSVPLTSTSSPGGQGILNLGSLLQLVSLPFQLNKLRAETKEADTAAQRNLADANKTTEDTEGVKLDNEFKQRTLDARSEAERLANEQSRQQIEETKQRISQVEADVKKKIQEAKTEEAKQSLLVQQAILTSEQANNIVIMRPFVQAELEAKTDQERSVARLNAVDTAYRQGLIDAGAIEAAVRETNANASEAEISAQVKEAEKQLKEMEVARKSGKFNLVTFDDTSLGARIVDSLYSGLSALSSSIIGK